MPWIEQRHRKYVPYERLDGRKVPGPRFATREEAEMFLRLVGLAGWEGACAYVAQAPVKESEPGALSVRERAIAAGAIDDPVALPITDPAPGRPRLGGPGRPGCPRGRCR